MTVDARFEKALRASDPVVELRRLAQHLLDAGGGLAGIRDEFERVRQQLRAAGGETDEDAVALRSSLLGERRWHLYARFAADALHVGVGPAHRGENPHGPRFPRGADLRREREQLRGIPRLGDDGVGILD